MRKIFVRGQQCQCVTDTKLGEQGIYSTDLYTGTAALVAQFGRSDVILAIRIEKWQRAKAINKVFARTGSGESLQQLLQYQSSCDDHIAPFDGLSQRQHLRSQGIRIAAKCQRSNAGVNKQRHERERSAL
jgi:hypothetical protein